MSHSRFQKPDRKTMRAHQTGNYLNFKEDFERALSTVNTDKPPDFRLNVDIATPDDSKSTGTLIYFLHSRRTCSVYGNYFITRKSSISRHETARHCVNPKSPQ